LQAAKTEVWEPQAYVQTPATPLPVGLAQVTVMLRPFGLLEDERVRNRKAASSHKGVLHSEHTR
jgi:hypothetical protein